MEAEVIKEDKGQSILKCEVVKAIHEIQNGKSTGVNELPVALYRPKCLNDESVGGIAELCNRIYQMGQRPDDFATTVMIPIPKKTDTKNVYNTEQ